MSAFDDLTLGEVDEIQTTALAGKQFSDDDANPLMIAGGVMWILQRRDNPALTWDAFKQQTTMGQIKAYSLEMQAAEQVDPTLAPSV